MSKKILKKKQRCKVYTRALEIFKFEFEKLSSETAIKKFMCSCLMDAFRELYPIKHNHVLSLKYATVALQLLFKEFYLQKPLNLFGGNYWFGFHEFEKRVEVFENCIYFTKH
jgi:hypothetical protein